MSTTISEGCNSRSRTGWSSSRTPSQHKWNSTYSIEKLHYVAGLCHTLIRDDFRSDIGGHRWFTKNDELNRWFTDLMRDELVKVDRISRILFEGNIFTYPINIKNVLKNAGLFSSGYALVSYLLAQAKGLTTDEAPLNMEDAYVKQFGRKLYEMFFKNYSEKVWGTSCREISADWVEQRTKGLSIFTALRDALAGSTGKVASLVEEFLYPRFGYGRISERMAEDIVAAGGQVLLKHKVLSVIHENSKVIGVQYEDSEGNQKTMDADAVVSSIPLTLLARNMVPAPPAEILAAAKKLRFRDLITVNVMLNREQVTKDTWLYIHIYQKFRSHDFMNPKIGALIWHRLEKLRLLQKYFVRSGTQFGVYPMKKSVKV